MIIMQPRRAGNHDQSRWRGGIREHIAAFRPGKLTSLKTGRIGMA